MKNKIIFKRYTREEIAELKGTPLYDLANTYIGVARGAGYEMNLSEALYLAKREICHKIYFNKNYVAIWQQIKEEAKEINIKQGKTKNAKPRKTKPKKSKTQKTQKRVLNRHSGKQPVSSKKDA